MAKVQNNVDVVLFIVHPRGGDVDEKLCIKRMNSFVKSHKEMPAYFSSVGMFTDSKTIFVSPTMNSSRYQFQ